MSKFSIQGETESKTTFVCKEILTQMYAAAEPPLDFNEVLENREDVDNNWYQNHTLSADRQQEIKKDIYEQFDLEDYEKSSIEMSLLNLAPKHPHDKS